jgi:hypothetical protein
MEAEAACIEEESKDLFAVNAFDPGDDFQFAEDFIEGVRAPHGRGSPFF